MEDIGSSDGIINKVQSKQTYITLLSTDDFLMGVLMLNWSLKHVHAKFPLFVLCSDIISDSSKAILNQYKIPYLQLASHIAFDEKGVNMDEEHEHWKHTFDKLYVWAQTQFEKVVYLDSDMQVVCNIDYLFNCPHMSAVRADQWNEPGIDKLNSGLMVIVPNLAEFEGLCQIIRKGVVKLRIMGDQDIIRAYYPDWGRRMELTLHSGLNVLYSEVSHGVIKKENVQPVSVIHYIGNRKPWMVSIRAIWRRSRNNFLGKHLLRYALTMYVYKLELLMFRIFRISCLE